MTPAAIAHEVAAALRSLPAGEVAPAQPLLQEALDAVSDGLPAEHVSVILHAALGRLDPSL